MSLVWEQEKVALDIIDDPGRHPFDKEAHPDFTVIEVTCDDIHDQQSMIRVGNEVADALGVPRVQQTPEWLEANARLIQELNDWLGY